MGFMTAAETVDREQVLPRTSLWLSEGLSACMAVGVCAHVDTSGSMCSH